MPLKHLQPGRLETWKHQAKSRSSDPEVPLHHSVYISGPLPVAIGFLSARICVYPRLKLLLVMRDADGAAADEFTDDSVARNKIID
jgi:hypothetical protein